MLGMRNSIFVTPIVVLALVSAIICQCDVHFGVDEQTGHHAPDATHPHAGHQSSEEHDSNASVDLCCLPQPAQIQTAESYTPVFVSVPVDSLGSAESLRVISSPSTSDVFQFPPGAPNVTRRFSVLLI